MRPRYTFGLLIGIVGLALNVCVSGFLGLCGPVLTLLGGALAGFLTVRREHPLAKNEGATAGAVSGGIAGALMLVGQLLGGIGALAIMQTLKLPLPFGATVPSGGDAAQQVGYYLGGLGTGICLGLVGLILAAAAGAGAGYLAAPQSPSMPQPPQAMD
jgi:hypothetical protein